MRKIIGITLCFFTFLCAQAQVTLLTDSNNPKEAEMVDYFTDNGLGNSVVTKAESGEHFNGVTYLAYQGSLEDAYVAAYNHKTQKWDGPYKAGVSLLGKTPGKKNDGHGKPTLIVDNEGFIHVAFGGHGGRKSHGENTLGNPHSGKQIHVVSKKPMDISSWEISRGFLLTTCFICHRQ
jgi:hypothetical protein